ncbi:Bug family tripartite tricarboxylate transporter substrate binding protein [Ramlibacter tataouinensis]|uniref:Candidate extracytoplasmic binding receptor n=1 Tax=Ramlibacter tataouinensis (strain ATCC BAA-407 / DSM 14655 / LMG 21543 / TTB310) TaxID=365046 RepID=F5Y6G5_RAMTT|nr:tripartite tricarboxylate transporter substrate binding protein [Ramlibacter tataouinensis]AEG94039.1 Candidate extracytoplasmic binding receptor [Ramlibacter tataouinensis TTB310]
MIDCVRRSLLLLALLAAGGASAQAYPTGPLKIIVPFPAGGSVDMVARAVAKRLTESLGQPVVVDNRAGASGNIGAEIAAKSPADGHTLFVSSSGVLAANMHLYKKTGFDPFKDFAPVIRLVNQPNILLVHPSLPAKSVQELVALAKAQPNKITMGNAGIGTGQDIAARQFATATGVNVLHVPYKGGAPALNDLLGGQIQTMFETSPTALPYAREKDGKLRALAITSAKRSPLLPDLPTVAEAGVPGYESITWIGLVVPAGTPKPAVDRLNAELNKGLKADMGKQFADISLDPIGGTPQEMAEMIRKDSAEYGRILKAAGVEPQ